MTTAKRPIVAPRTPGGGGPSSSASVLARCAGGAGGGGAGVRHGHVGRKWKTSAARVAEGLQSPA
eukprot:scaffold13237_cov124-Isochrysis_galbana.AAC.1